MAKEFTNKIVSDNPTQNNRLHNLLQRPRLYLTIVAIYFWISVIIELAFLWGALSQVFLPHPPNVVTDYTSAWFLGLGAIVPSAVAGTWIFSGKRKGGFASATALLLSTLVLSIFSYRESFTAWDTITSSFEPTTGTMTVLNALMYFPLTIGWKKSFLGLVIGLPAFLIASYVFVSLLSYEPTPSFGSSLFSLTGYDTSDTNVLYFHDGNSVSLNNSANDGLQPGDKIALHIKNVGSSVDKIQKITLFKTDYFFDDKARSMPLSFPISIGKFGLARSGSVNANWQENTTTPNQEYTIVISYNGDAGNIPLDKEMSIGIVTSYNDFVFTITNGKRI